jgi:hypothetical protein
MCLSDSRSNFISVFEKIDNVPTGISTIGGRGSADGQLSRPWDLAIDNDHNLLVCDSGNQRIQKFAFRDEIIKKYYSFVNFFFTIIIMCANLIKF